MELVTSIPRLRELIRDARRLKLSIGCVPTMGALHCGHGALIERARAECGLAVVTLFVNPIQFDRKDDYEQYARDLEADGAFCRQRGVDVLFAPSEAEMYPHPAATFVDAPGLSDRLCGKFRPGHFRGVATVVAKLFNIVQPDRAYFGQNDAQQLQVIRKMVRDLDMPVEVRAVPTVREPDGLALSSRHVRLSPEERKVALVLSRALREAEQRYRAGERSGVVLRQVMREMLAEEPLARPDYVSVADPETLLELDRIDGPALLSLAVRIGPVRLIDNIPLP